MDRLEFVADKGEVIKKELPDEKSVQSGKETARWLDGQITIEQIAT